MATCGFQEGSVMRLDVNVRSSGVKEREKMVLGGWGTPWGVDGRATFFRSPGDGGGI